MSVRRRIPTKEFIRDMNNRLRAVADSIRCPRCHQPRRAVTVSINGKPFPVVRAEETCTCEPPTPAIGDR